jgi:uncharacterized membrane protein SpoIIM required for sporulation
MRFGRGIKTNNNKKIARMCIVWMLIVCIFICGIYKLNGACVTFVYMFPILNIHIKKEEKE